MLLGRHRRPIQTHRIEDDLEKTVLQLRGKMATVKQMEELNEFKKDKTLEQLVHQKRNEIVGEINHISTRYGVDLADVYGKLDAEKTKGDILKTREEQKERQTQGEGDQIVDLLDENGLLLKRNVNMQELSTETHPLNRYYKNYQKMLQGIAPDSVQESEVQAQQESINKFLGHNRNFKYIVPYKYYVAGKNPLPEHIQHAQEVNKQREEYEKKLQTRKHMERYIQHSIFRSNRVNKQQNKLQQREQNLNEVKQRRDQLGEYYNNIQDPAVDEELEDLADRQYNREQELVEAQNKLEKLKKQGQYPYKKFEREHQQQIAKIENKYKQQSQKQRQDQKIKQIEQSMQQSTQQKLEDDPNYQKRSQRIQEIEKEIQNILKNKEEQKRSKKPTSQKRSRSVSQKRSKSVQNEEEKKEHPFKNNEIRQQYIQDLIDQNDRTSYEGNFNNKPEMVKAVKKLTKPDIFGQQSYMADIDRLHKKELIKILKELQKKGQRSAFAP